MRAAHRANDVVASKAAGESVVEHMSVVEAALLNYAAAAEAALAARGVVVMQQKGGLIH